MLLLVAERDVGVLTQEGRTSRPGQINPAKGYQVLQKPLVPMMP